MAPPVHGISSVEITKSVTILAVPGAVGSVVAPTNQSAIDVTAGNAQVTLRNLVVVSLGAPGTNTGLRVSESAMGAHLRVESSRISGVSTGIMLEAEGNLTVIDSIVQRGTNGIVARRGRAVVSRCRLIGNVNLGLAAAMTTTGEKVVVRVEETLGAQNGTAFAAIAGATGLPSTMYVRNSAASGNNENGFLASGASGPAVIQVSGSVANGNGGYGFQAAGRRQAARASR